MSLSDSVSIRVMEPSEFESMRAVSVAAFDDPSIGTLLDELRRSWCWHDELSFVAVDAEAGGDIVGHVLFTSAILDAPDRLVDVLVLSPVGVVPERQRTGIGSLLITTALEALAERSEPLVFLEGHPAYYPRFGFRPGSELGFDAPSRRIPDPAFMVYPLPRYEPSMTGRLVYPDAFWRTDSVGLR